MKTSVICVDIVKGKYNLTLKCFF